MPNRHKPDREPIGFMLPRTTMIRLKKYAVERNIKLGEAVLSIINEAVAHVTLTSTDYANIAKATKTAEKNGRRIATPFSTGNNSTS